MVGMRELARYVCWYNFSTLGTIAHAVLMLADHVVCDPWLVCLTRAEQE